MNEETIVTPAPETPVTPEVAPTPAVEDTPVVTPETPAVA
jgi:hypothetical protein